MRLRGRVAGSRRGNLCVTVSTAVGVVFLRLVVSTLGGESMAGFSRRRTACVLRADSVLPAICLSSLHCRERSQPACTAGDFCTSLYCGGGAVNPPVLPGTFRPGKGDPYKTRCLVDQHVPVYLGIVQRRGQMGHNNTPSSHDRLVSFVGPKALPSRRALAMTAAAEGGKGRSPPTFAVLIAGQF